MKRALNVPHPTPKLCTCEDRRSSISIVVNGRLQTPLGVWFVLLYFFLSGQKRRHALPLRGQAGSRPNGFSSKAASPWYAFSLLSDEFLLKLPVDSAKSLNRQFG